MTLKRDITFLIVEDDPSLRLKMKKDLEGMIKVIIHEASRGQEALDILKAHAIDLIVTSTNKANTIDRQKYEPLKNYNLKTVGLTVVDGLLDGLSNREIADRVRLSEQSVKYHIAKLFKTFQVKTRKNLRDKLNQLLEEK